MTLVAGCGTKPNPASASAMVKVHLMAQGKPYELRNSESLQMYVAPAAKDGKPIHGEFDPVESVFAFVLPEPVAPGEYRLVVSSRLTPGGEDRFRNAFSRDATPLRLSITSDSEQMFVADLAAKEVRRK